MRREMLIGITAAVLLVATLPAKAQSVRSLVNGGNDLYKDQKYTDAEVNYRKALEKEKDLVQGHFNLGNALNKEGKYDEAVRQFDLARGKAASPETKGHAWYNIGNSMMGEQKYQEAVDAYIKSLQLNPRDQEAKYNLSYALEKLKQQQQQQQQQNKNQDKKNQKQDQKNQQNKDKQQKQDQQKQDQKKQDQQQNPPQNQPQQQQKQMSRADAERILDVLKNSEKDVQKKLRARQAVRPKTDKDW
jgi:Ca-activated chloride channel family protein